MTFHVFVYKLLATMSLILDPNDVRVRISEVDEIASVRQYHTVRVAKFLHTLLE
jgi:hypothetical protein